eukprot:352186-Chlamydomonas_euryale.AAC.1
MSSKPRPLRQMRWMQLLLLPPSSPCCATDGPGPCRHPRFIPPSPPAACTRVAQLMDLDQVVIPDSSNPRPLLPAPVPRS